MRIFAAAQGLSASIAARNAAAELSPTTHDSWPCSVLPKLRHTNPGGSARTRPSGTPDYDVAHALARRPRLACVLQHHTPRRVGRRYPSSCQELDIGHRGSDSVQAMLAHGQRQLLKHTYQRMQPLALAPPSVMQIPDAVTRCEARWIRRVQLASRLHHAVCEGQAQGAPLRLRGERHCLQPLQAAPSALQPVHVYLCHHYAGMLCDLAYRQRVHADGRASDHDAGGVM